MAARQGVVWRLSEDGSPVPRATQASLPLFLARWQAGRARGEKLGAASSSVGVRAQLVDGGVRCRHARRFGGLVKLKLLPPPDVFAEEVPLGGHGAPQRQQPTRKDSPVRRLPDRTDQGTRCGRCIQVWHCLPVTTTHASDLIFGQKIHCTDGCKLCGGLSDQTQSCLESWVALFIVNVGWVGPRCTKRTQEGAKTTRIVNPLHGMTERRGGFLEGDMGLVDQAPPDKRVRPRGWVAAAAAAMVMACHGCATTTTTTTKGERATCLACCSR
mmetsp:Transcript_38754/g.97627  ORF Transcript_38754/g.97627 Transcript_38754/m.97627 type:complete len:271 (-) Transcript_38754:20-832(-)